MDQKKSLQFYSICFLMLYVFLHGNDKNLDKNTNYIANNPCGKDYSNE